MPYDALKMLFEGIDEGPRPSDSSKKVYLAGPDVFFKDAKKHAMRLKVLCRKHGLDGLFPLDAEITFTPEMTGPEKAHAIFEANLGLIRRADGVLANMTPFRGPSADVGTGWEMGFAYGLGKPVVAYTSHRQVYGERVTPDEYEIENFGGIDNLMLTCGSRAIVRPPVTTVTPLWSTVEEAVVNMADILGVPAHVD
jgi:nucleoside 2-deoxyribosyltransferase